VSIKNNATCKIKQIALCKILVKLIKSMHLHSIVNIGAEAWAWKAGGREAVAPLDFQTWY